MTRQEIKKPDSSFLLSMQLPVPAPRALSGQNPRGSGPQKPYLTGRGFLRPHWWPGAGCRTWGGSTPPLRCLDLGFPIPALTLTWCHHPSLLLCWCCPCSPSPPAPGPPCCRPGQGFNLGSSCGVVASPHRCWDPHTCFQGSIVWYPGSTASVDLDPSA